MKAGLHYIVVNLMASFLFLIGVAMIYGMTGTLNMADLAQRIVMLASEDRALFEAGAAILGVAFLTKAAIWPLNFWLPSAYAAAGAPVGAVFSLMTKVGVYAVLRVGTLLASADVQTSFIDVGFFYGGLATLGFGVIGMLAAQQLGRLVAYSVIVSSGLLLMALGLRIETLTAPVMFYLASSVLATGAFFMVNGMTERTRVERRRDGGYGAVAGRHLCRVWRERAARSALARRRSRRRDSRGDGVSRARVHLLRVAGRRHAAALRLRREVRHVARRDWRGVGRDVVLVFMGRSSPP